MRFRTNRLNAVLLVATLVITTLASTGTARAEKRASALPFKGSAKDIILNPPTGPADMVGVQHYAMKGVGNATHLGKFTRTKEMWFDWATLKFWGTIVFIAANGDELYVKFEGGPFNPATGQTVGQYAITGGTGRFAGASGKADFMAVSDLVHVGNVFDGSITLGLPLAKP